MEESVIDQTKVLQSMVLKGKTLPRYIFLAAVRNVRNLAAHAALLLCMGYPAVTWAQAATEATPTPTPQAGAEERAESRAERAAEKARLQAERAREKAEWRAQRNAEQAQRNAERMREMGERMREHQLERIGRSLSTLHTGLPGKWWSNPEMAEKLGLTKDQQAKMDDIFQQSRLKLIDANASLEKEETIMEPLLQADQPDEPKILAQIDRVAQARAELEKTNARMLLGIRKVLTADQWEKLRAEAPHSDHFEVMAPEPVVGVHVHPSAMPVPAAHPLE